MILLVSNCNILHLYFKIWETIGLQHKGYYFFQHTLRGFSVPHLPQSPPPKKSTCPCLVSESMLSERGVIVMLESNIEMIDRCTFYSFESSV